MIEIPAVAINAEAFAAELDFFQCSIFLAYDSRSIIETMQQKLINLSRKFSGNLNKILPEMSTETTTLRYKSYATYPGIFLATLNIARNRC